LPAAAAPAATSQPAPNGPAALATTTPAPVDDPVARLIATAEQHFAVGQTHLRAGRLVKARGEFDAAISVLLRAPGGAKSDPRLNAEYEQLLARIAALEATALRQGDGFSESTTEPAAIDELLAVATFPRATPSTETAVAKEVGEAMYDLPVISNDKVLSYVELFQGTLRPFLEQGLSRGSRYLPRIRSIFEIEGVPLDLAYVPLIESAYKSTALSRAKAKGMWQFQLPTAGDYKLRFDWFIDERSDFEKSTRAAARHFKMLANMFDGDWNLALAAYNVGQGRVQTAIKRAKTNDYWELTDSTRYLPKDTRAYVPMIWAAIIIAKSPAEFGFDIETQPALDYDIVAVPNAIRLDTVAEWAGTTIEVLRDLNPELRRQTTPMGPYNLRLPLGTKGDVEEKLWVADPSTFTSFVKHTVKSGETLSTIARRYRIATTELAEMNGIKRTARLRQGQALYVPGALTGPATTAAASGRAASRGTVTYQVKRGDTLYEIARQFDVTVDELKSWNNLKSSVLAIGKRLTIHRN
jgi:membrane-bound lytic murein transglycosylase D